MQSFQVDVLPKSEIFDSIAVWHHLSGGGSLTTFWKIEVAKTCFPLFLVEMWLLKSNYLGIYLISGAFIIYTWGWAGKKKGGSWGNYYGKQKRKQEQGITKKYRHTVGGGQTFFAILSWILSASPPPPPSPPQHKKWMLPLISTNFLPQNELLKS